MSGPDGLVVEQVWRYPVKSLGGEPVEASWADGRGLLGDRVWAVQDGDGKLGSGKNTRRFKRMVGLLDLSARYLADPSPARIEPPVLTGPDGTAYPVATGAADAFIRDSTGLQRVRVRCDTGIMHFDEVPFSLIGTATIDWLAVQLPGVPIDARRLRPNLVVRTTEPFIEESWLGRPIRIGSGHGAACVVFDRVLERCVMVGMRQPGLPASSRVLKRIARRDDNPLRLAIGGHISGAGTVRVGDPVLVSPRTFLSVAPDRLSIPVQISLRPRAASLAGVHPCPPPVPAVRLGGSQGLLSSWSIRRVARPPVQPVFRFAGWPGSGT